MAEIIIKNYKKSDLEKGYKRIASSIILTLYEDEGVIVEAYKCNNSALLVKL